MRRFLVALAVAVLCGCGSGGNSNPSAVDTPTVTQEQMQGTWEEITSDPLLTVGRVIIMGDYVRIYPQADYMPHTFRVGSFEIVGATVRLHMDQYEDAADVSFADSEEMVWYATDGTRNAGKYPVRFRKIR